MTGEIESRRYACVCVCFFSGVRRRFSHLFIIHSFIPSKGEKCIKGIVHGKPLDNTRYPREWERNDKKKLGKRRKFPLLTETGRSIHCVQTRPRSSSSSDHGRTRCSPLPIARAVTRLANQPDRQRSSPSVIIIEPFPSLLIIVE